VPIPPSRPWPGGRRPLAGAPLSLKHTGRKETKSSATAQLFVDEEPAGVIFSFNRLGKFAGGESEFLVRLCYTAQICLARRAVELVDCGVEPLP
jgi:hypothetical protein